MAPRTKLTLATSVLLAMVAIVFWWPSDDTAAPATSPPAHRDASAARPAIGTVPEQSVATVERIDATPPRAQEPPAPKLPNATDAEHSVTSEVMPVKDLVFPGAGSAPPFYASMNDLVANLKEATDPNYWRDEAGITGEDSGYLAVKASPRMQQQVKQVLTDIRRLSSASGRGR